MIKYLLGRASTGKFRFAVVECDEEWHSIGDGRAGYIIQRSYGQVRGKTTLSPQIIVDRTKQKRNWQEQYTLQFNSEVKKYLDKGYKEIDKHPNEYTDDELLSIFGDVKTNQYGVIKPQLAKQADKVTNPKIFNKEWLISRKLDGVKALFYWDGKKFIQLAVVVNITTIVQFTCVLTLLCSLSSKKILLLFLMVSCS